MSGNFAFYSIGSPDLVVLSQYGISAPEWRAVNTATTPSVQPQKRTYRVEFAPRTASWVSFATLGSLATPARLCGGHPGSVSPSACERSGACLWLTCPRSYVRLELASAPVAL